MSMKVVERLQGMGTVTRENGQQIGKRRYSLTVYQQVLEAAGMGQATEKIEGLKQVEGRVAVTDGESFTLMDANDLLLTVEDGRVLPFLLQDNSGRIAARGEFK